MSNPFLEDYIPRLVKDVFDGIETLNELYETDPMLIEAELKDIAAARDEFWKLWDKLHVTKLRVVK